MRTILTLLVLLVVALPLAAQDRVPPPASSTTIDEMITMTGDTPFTKAMTIFSSAFKRYAEKPVVFEEPGTGGKSTKSKEIGINIPSMYWRDAFELVLRVNGYWYVEQADYVRVYSSSVSDSPKDSVTTRKAVNTREVEISAIFFEANRSEMESLGIDWSLTNTAGSAVTKVGITNVGQSSTSSESGESSGGSQIEYGVTGQLRAFNNALDIMTMLKAIQSESLGELISAPSITVRSNETGRIQVGQDFSVKQRDFSGNTTEKFYSAGTIIEVTPTIMEYDSLEFVHLLIQAERSSVLPDPISTIINKTVANTSVILLDQEETVVGGLYTNDTQSLRRGVPFLKDLPWWVFGLRYIFGYNEDVVTKKELIIILRARIMPSLQDRATAKVAEIRAGQRVLQNQYENIDASRSSLLEQIRAAKERINNR
jgi:general secretion pathway protein D